MAAIVTSDYVETIWGEFFNMKLIYQRDEADELRKQLLLTLNPISSANDLVKMTLKDAFRILNYTLKNALLNVPYHKILLCMEVSVINELIMTGYFEKLCADTRVRHLTNSS